MAFIESKKVEEYIDTLQSLLVSAQDFLSNDLTPAGHNFLVTNHTLELEEAAKDVNSWQVNINNN